MGASSCRGRSLKPHSLAGFNICLVAAILGFSLPLLIKIDFDEPFANHYLIAYLLASIVVVNFKFDFIFSTRIKVPF